VEGDIVMDKFVKQSIDARKNAIETSCKLDAEGKKKVAELFDEIKKLGEGEVVSIAKKNGIEMFYYS
jgi:hypothetical protein